MLIYSILINIEYIKVFERNYKKVKIEGILIYWDVVHLPSDTYDFKVKVISIAHLKQKVLHKKTLLKQI